MVVSDKLLPFPLQGESVPNEAKDYTSEGEIAGVDATTNKYIGIYEVDSNDKIVGYRLITLTADKIQKESDGPAGVNGAKAWLRADKQVVVDGNGKVSSWEDTSGNSNHFNQTNENRRPTLKDNEGRLNFNRVIDFQTHYLQKVMVY